MQMDLMQSLQRCMKVVKSGTVHVTLAVINVMRAWSKLDLDQPAPSVSGGSICLQLVLINIKNGVFQKSVDSNSGNGAIKTGQTSTYTGMVFDLTADFGYHS